MSSIKTLGEGAYATVYEGIYAGEKVAIKEIKYGEADAYAQHVIEVDVMSRMRSGYIVSLYGASIEKSKAFLVMEYLPNGALFDYVVHSGSELPWPRRWLLARDTTLGLHYLHTRKPPLVHRDFKSHNLLLDSEGRVKVCDFGLTAPAIPPPAGGCGTPRWLAPEVNDGQAYTMASDVYSLGIVFWEIAARQVVFGNDTTDEVLAKVAAGKRPTIPEDCPEDFADMIRSCWHQHADQRPTTEKLLRIFSRKGFLDHKGGGDRKVLADLQAKCAQQLQEIEIGAQVRDQLQSRITTLEREVGDRGNEVSSLKRTVEDWEQRMRKDRERIVQLERELDSMRPDLEQQRQAAQKAKKKLADQKRAAERDLRQVKDDCATQLEQVGFDLAKLKRELDRERQSKEALEETIARMTRR